jgi:hypothetical protein
MVCHPGFRSWSPNIPTIFRNCPLKADSLFLEASLQTPTLSIFRNQLLETIFKTSF